jgi:hypothetical protein
MLKLPLLILFPIVLLLFGISSASAKNILCSVITIFAISSDTIPVNPSDTLPVTLPVTLPADTSAPGILQPDSVILDALRDSLPVDTAEIPVEQKDTLITTPASTIPSRPVDAVVIPPGAKVPVPYNEQMSFSVPWDSLIYSDDHTTVSRIYSSRSYFGPHELPAGELSTREILSRMKPSDIFTVLILMSLLLIGLANYFFPQRLREVIMAAWAPRHYNQLERETGLMDHWVSFFLFFNFLFVFVILTYQAVMFFGADTLVRDIPVYFLLTYITIAVVAFYIIKYVLMFFLAWVFKTKESSLSYFRNILIVNNFVGMALLPAIIIYTYNPSDIIFYFAMGMLIIINLYKVIRGSIIGYQKSGFTAYYLILYLCAIEIAPLLLIIKISKNYITG